MGEAGFTSLQRAYAVSQPAGGDVAMGAVLGEELGLLLGFELGRLLGLELGRLLGLELG